MRATAAGCGKIHAAANQQEDNEMLLCAVQNAGLAMQPYQVELMLGRMRVQIQVDTGDAVSLVSEDLWKQLVNPPPLTPSTVKLKTYGGAPLGVKGQAEVLVDYYGQRKILPVAVVPGNKPALLASIFTPGLGLIKGFQGKLSVKRRRNFYEESSGLRNWKDNKERLLTKV
ncbi:hypothetical protein MTO96_035619 [Rhipicephalus appendiculatus]